MRSMLNIFDKKQSNLKTLLSADPKPERVILEIKNSLDDIHKNYRHEDSRNVMEKTLSPNLIKLVKESLDILLCCQAEFWQRSVSINENNKSVKWIANLIIRIGQVLLIIGIFWSHSITSQFLIGVLSLILLLSELLRIVFLDPPTWVGRLPQILGFKNQTSLSLDRSDQDIKTEIRVDTERMVTNLSHSISSMDSVINSAQNLLEEQLETFHHKEDGFDRNTLVFFQDLYEAVYRKDGALALKKIDNSLDSILEKYSIEVEEWSPENSFGFQTMPSLQPDLELHRTIRPVLMKNNRILIPGKVVEPSKKG